MSTRRLAVVSAGLGVPSSTRLLADRLTQAVEQQLAEEGYDVETTVIELRELAVDIAKNLVSGFPSSALAEAVDAVTMADGLIAVTPIFMASYSGLFKSFFDILDKDSVTGQPVLAAATGGSARHSLVLEHGLRPMLSYLRMVVVATSVYAAPEDWGTTQASLVEGLPARVVRAGRELAMLMATRHDDAVNGLAEPAVGPLAEQLAAIRSG